MRKWIVLVMVAVVLVAGMTCMARRGRIYAVRHYQRTPDGYDDMLVSHGHRVPKIWDRNPVARNTGALRNWAQGVGRHIRNTYLVPLAHGNAVTAYFDWMEGAAKRADTQGKGLAPSPTTFIKAFGGSLGATFLDN